MKCAIGLLVCACLGASAFADSEQWQSPWFTGIGANATSTSSMDAMGGTWAFDSDGASVENKKLVLNQISGESATFTISEDADDTDTLQRITLTGTFEPITAADLLAGSAMVTAGAQVGFTVVKGNPNKYYAWVGTAGDSAAIDDWIELSGTPTDAETEVRVDMAYWTSKVTFYVKNGDTYTALTATINEQTVSEIPFTPAQSKKVSSVQCLGSGTLATVGGAVQLGVAENNGRKYGTVAAAIEAAQLAGGSSTVKLLKNIEGGVTIPKDSTVALDTNGKEVSGGVVNNGTTQINVPVCTSGDYEIEVSGSGTTTPVPADSSKDATIVESGNKKYIRVVTKPALVTATTVAGKAVPSPASNSGFKAFLEANIPSYTAANTTAGAISGELNANGANGISKINSYILGLDPTKAADKITVVQPATRDVAADGITLAVPKVNPPADSGYEVVYKVYNKATSQYVDGEYSSATAVKLPLAQGHYRVDAVIKAK